MKQALMILGVLVAVAAGAQKKVVKQIDSEVSLTELKAHLYFLAADELRGRNTGTLENEIAARYIAERFRAYGVKTPPGMDTYMQPVKLTKGVSPQQTTFQVADSTFGLDDMVFYSSSNGTFSGELVYVNFGLEEDLEGLDLKGKIVVAKVGNGNPEDRLSPYTRQKRDACLEAGAVALVELYRPGKYPWKMIQYYFSGEKFSLDLGSEDGEDDTFPIAWLLDDAGLVKFFESQNGTNASITIGGQANESLTVPNVVGYIEGTDPELKDEYVMITAHFDHVGVSNVEGDSIWNGARDNGIGIANMLTAAEYLGKNPPKRSVAFLACNAEEKGLLGSAWYAENPVFPLEKTVYDLNTDTGGYNDVSKVTVVGFHRTSVTPLFAQAADAFGLEAIDDPLPEENYYDRSDNVSFAAKGVPAVSYDPGYTEMNEEITKYYHQPEDEAHTLDYDYLTKYSKSFIYAVTLIGNYTGEIFWTEGDKYEDEGKALYGKN
ncbi:M28 family peptidase [Marinoscillum furvescens]|uniref:Peptidase M28-like protein n=1 Tax=Marinoscillum furvescens DSM 4134 TaxID=1122208 RepID=A0A3D9L6S3_MARFU|nr:M28 family peptidase [Marinoscillum furvescens]RED99868.1 peptidase M28-like protein [Marinoscillum furvescens DSM 4134]